MAATERQRARNKKPITDIGHVVPGNLKFGIIVTVAVLWGQFLKSLLNEAFSIMNVTLPLLSVLLVAVSATILGYLVLVSYRKIRSRLKRILI